MLLENDFYIFFLVFVFYFCHVEFICSYVHDDGGERSRKITGTSKQIKLVQIRIF